ncbi:uncharacterized protein BT62DRAFT_904944 [Guyanagaster necrorhizus]|uniref:Uncharacterized protein n=1 Tax=Guyanagaster necrorhizus TaxID=856835 RepID=A0A9P7VLJ9_9AGAR|nr:uncharacterized protein BT62DRAFT_904944 [Guyanagaster necrorhizus MCA 3950]KAG7442765.1 hypothetical protein BT62DRAFT_904944 [Guyanagaster necrorhizus MCA 3950]
MEPLPPLPKINGDYNIMLDVYTHRTARPGAGADVMDEEYGNTERLAELGKKVLDLVVIHHFFFLKPHLAAEEVTNRKAETLSDDAIVRWTERYDLKKKIRAFPHTVLDDPNELRVFFHTFIGALYIRNGMAEVQDWISRLIDPTSEPATIIGPPPQQTQSLPTQPLQFPPPLPPSFNPASPPPVAQTSQGGDSLIMLQLVNQMAAQQRRAVMYQAQSEGPPHAPTWTVQCLLDGALVGTGTGRSQKLAKEEAARQAWNVLGVH